jgi:hypothetical protein
MAGDLGNECLKMRRVGQNGSSARFGLYLVEVRLRSYDLGMRGVVCIAARIAAVEG